MTVLTAGERPDPAPAFGAGPIAVRRVSPSESAVAIEAAIDGNVWTFTLERFAHAAVANPLTNFVGANVPQAISELAGALIGTGNAATRSAVLSLADRWVDVNQLDLRLRAANGDDRLRLRTGADMADAGNEKVALWWAVLIDAYGRLRADWDRMCSDAGPRRPEFHPVPEPTAEETENFRRSVQRVVGVLTPDHSLPPLLATNLSPVRVEVQALTSLLCRPTTGGSGLQFSPDHRAELMVEFQKRYRAASLAVLERPALAAVFEANGDSGAIKLDKGGHPVDRRKDLDKWLRSAFDRLFDSTNVSPPIPCDPKSGSLTRNPELWGVWTGCDNELRAWRELYRAAEFGRLATDRSANVQPRYESMPTLRSLSPDLAYYRAQPVRAFRPTSGHIFVAGQLSDLRFRALAAVLDRDGYIHARGRDVLHALLNGQPVLGWEQDCCDRITAELFLADRIADQIDDTPAIRSLIHAPPEFRQRAIEALRTTQSRETDWADARWLTEAVLDTVGLGLPGSLWRVYVQNEYGPDVPESRLSRIRDRLCFVVPGLGEWWADNILDRHAVHRDESGADSERRLADSPNRDTAAAALRRRIQGLGVRTIPINELSLGPDETRSDLLISRALSLGGRPTLKAGPAAVRQWQVLLTADEVMAAVLFALTRYGYRILGVAGNEFVVEVPEDSAEEHGKGVFETAGVAANQFLGYPVQVCVNVTNEW